MKKKIISFMLALCLIIPCAFMLTACGPENLSPNGKTYVFFKYVIDYSQATNEDWTQAKADKDKTDMTNEQFATWLLENYENQFSEISIYTFATDNQVLTQSATVGNETMSQNFNYTKDNNVLVFGENVHIYIIDANTINIDEADYGAGDNENIKIYAQYVVSK